MAGLFGGPGVGNYAAGNVFLDALAAHRRARGRKGVSLAWGLWEGVGMGRAMGALDMRLMAGTASFGVLGPQEGLALLDSALSCEQPLVVPAPLDRGVLRSEARAGEIPALLRGLVRVPARYSRAHAHGAGALAAQLAGLEEAARERAALELVQAQVAGVLGHSSPAAIDPDSAFRDLGFDSLTAVELRNRLGGAAGLRLPATLIFDHPTARALSRHLLEQLSGGAGASLAPLPARRARGVDEPIAIVGIGCRFPGGVRSAQELWELVTARRDAIGGFPADRGWDLERLYDPDPERSGTSYTREGGFLYDAADFDPGFFGINAREALAMDPQQRLLLETAWEALEDAGIDPRTLRGTPTGVFAGLMYHDYATGLSAVPAELEGYVSTGNAGAVASGRLAYSFGFEGPAVTVDTACSSSLVALHWASQALRAGECSLALAGGATVLATPGLFLEFSRQRVLSADGRCRAFAEGAGGVGWGEGAGLLLLERLSDAERQGHRILALLRGSAVNQDGASNGLTAPNGPSQQRVIAQALANAGLAPGDVDLLEAHGTGTSLGDPIEAQALLATYGHERPAERPLHLGSVKSNIGHTQAAAGVAGVIKAVMALRHGVLPPTLHAGEPSRQIDWSSGSVALLTEELPWEPREPDAPRRAGVSSFGISGTNAHVVLEEAPAAEQAPAAADGEHAASALGLAPGGAVPWMLSGRGEEALRAQASRLAEFVRTRPELDVHDVGHSLVNRAAFERRAVLVGAAREELLDGLGALAAGEGAPGLLDGAADLGDGRVAFVFPGQGSQWAGMAVELLDASPVFAAALRECGEALAEFADWSLEDVLRGVNDAPGLEGVDVVQPALFAVMVALARLWQACGVQPAVVIGHSQGEIAAAHVAGGLSLRDAARLVVVRSRLLVGLMGRGGMASVALSERELAPHLERWDGAVGVAAVNGPGSVVVSGERRALDELLEELVAAGVRAREIPVGYASHSEQIEEIREELLEACAGIEPVSGSVPFLSTVTGETMDTADLDAGYWFRNLREPVQFEGAVRALLSDGCRAFIELSPHPVLTVGVQETAEDLLGRDTAGAAAPDGSSAEGHPARAGGVLAAGSLRRDDGGPTRFLRSLGEVWVRGVEVDWTRVFAGSGAERVDLPTYAFQRERFWLSSGGAPGDPTASGQLLAGHPLLGACLRLAGEGGWLFTGRLALDSHPWLVDHAVMGSVLLPGTAFLDLALHAGAEIGHPAIGELVLHAPLVVPEGGAVELQVAIAPPDQEGRCALEFHSRAHNGDATLADERPWVRNASAALVADADVDGAAGELAGEWPPPGAQPVELDGCYDRFAEWGLEYGPLFQGLLALWRRGDELFADVALPSGEREQARSFGIHPALLDAALHSVGAGMAGAEAEQGGVLLPFSWADVRLHARGAHSLRVRIAPAGEGQVSLLAADELGDPVASVRSLAVRPFSAEQLAPPAAQQDALFALRWQEVAPGSSAAPSPAAVLLDLGEEAALAGEDLAASAHDVLHRVLDVVQRWLGDERNAGSRLVVVTRRAVAVEDVECLAQAGVWGLVRSAQSEHPGRLTLIDSDGEQASLDALAGALELDEPQMALREGAVLVPRLARMDAAPEAEFPFDPEQTVLITGGTGGLGALLARHLVGAHGARHVLLASRRGGEAPGAAELRADLETLGADVRIEACDVGERGELAALIDSIDAEHPLGAVVHAAGVLDDGTIGSLTEARLDGVLAPKLDAAWHLHELTEGMGLQAFVLFSSVAGIFGGPGQGSYAAANAFLDALAAHRRTQGLAATALAWGQWAQEASGSTMTGALGAGDLVRLTRSGVVALSAAEGLELFDAACAAGQPLLVPIHLDTAMLRAQARGGTLPAVLRGLVRVPARRAGEAGAGGASLLARLAGMGEGERAEAVMKLLRREVAAVLGHSSAEAVDPLLAFKDLGFDSLTAVELRNRLDAATGLRLPATLVFDHPTLGALCEFLLGEALEPVPGPAPARPPAPRAPRRASRSRWRSWA